MRGRNILRAPYRNEILSLLADGEKKTAELVAALEGTPQAINYALSRLVEKAEIVRVQRGVYTLPKS
ncbi:ArsR family transcriptional regulator [Candidatus Poribacteria bacterium]|nr:ArsR family transcriptional regulator [Candidatus Poribacteria bacterium]